MHDTCLKNPFANIRKIRDHRWKRLKTTHLNGVGPFLWKNNFVIYVSWLLKKWLFNLGPPPFRCALLWQSSLRSRIFCISLSLLANWFCLYSILKALFCKTIVFRMRVVSTPTQMLRNKTSLKPILGWFLIEFSKMYRHKLVFTLGTLARKLSTSRN